MKKLITFCAAAAIVLAMSTATAWAAHGSEVWLFQVGYMPTQSAGSIPGPIRTTLTNSSIYTEGQTQTQNYTASGNAFADMGELYTHYNDEISVFGGIARANLGGNIYTWFKDTITVLPGESGLHNGDPVQIVFYSGLVGQMTNPGYASGASGIDFLPQLLKNSIAIAQDPLASTGIYGPNGYFTDYMHMKVVNCNIGDVLTLQASLHSTINGSGVSQGLSVVFDHGFRGTTRVGYAAGYEDILLQSEVGAVIIPEPATITVLSLGVFSLIFRRRK